MIKMELIIKLSSLNLTKISGKEKSLFISYLLFHITHELSQKFNSNHQIYNFNHTNTFMEDSMLEANFLKYLIQDILSTKEYSLAGIAIYVRVPEEIICDLFAGLIKNPSSSIWNKIIELHTTVRRDFYKALIKKIISDSTTKKEDKSEEGASV